MGRAVWTEAAMTSQAACTTSLHGPGLGKREGPESIPAAELSVMGSRSKEISQPDKPLETAPRVPFCPPFPASGESEGPVQQSRQAQRGGPLLAPVPATATAWQQRALCWLAINNPPAAAAVRQPAALGGKCGALSAPARGASTEPSRKHSKHLLVLLNCLA